MNSTMPDESRFKRILFCTDFSESADFAFEFAVDATRRRPGATLHVLHVVHEVEAQFWNSYIYEVDNVDDQAKRDIDAHIAESYLAQLPRDFPVEVAFRVGPEAGQILEYAQEMNIDLIVLGRQGHRTVSHALFGKVTEKIVRKSRCPVMVIPLSYRGDNLANK